MARLMLVLLALGAVLALVLAAGSAVGRLTTPRQEVSVSKTTRTLSYILLILLMFGVVTGWLGGL